MATSGNPQFGRYILVSKLGMGGMAEVFKAQFKGNPELLVAIKRILPQFSQDKKLITMMVNEARLSMSLNHPNIVPVIDFGVVDGDYFMAMEYIKGKDLKSIMIRCKTKQIDLPIQMAVYIVSKFLRALDFAHSKRDNFDQPLNIVHRDVSPHNILISYWGEVKILDFGIAKASSVAGSTQIGILKGKFSYMSPEQAHGEQVDFSTDIFAAGIVLWELLTLESYYKAESDIKLLNHVREAKFQDPSALNPRISKKIVNILAKALQKKSTKRWDSAGEFSDALDAYLEETFGPVTDADLGTFIRSIFGISSEEIVQKHATGRDIAGIVNPSLEEVTPPETKAPSYVHSRPNRMGERTFSIPTWAWQAPLLSAALAGVAWALLHSSPLNLWKKFNQGIDSMAAVFYSSSSIKNSKSVVEIVPPAYSKPNYVLYYAQGVRETMEDFSFEIFDRLRNLVEDLTLDPRPSGAERLPERSGSWVIRQGGFKIIYTLGDQPKTVTINTIEKTN